MPGEKLFKPSDFLEGAEAYNTGEHYVYFWEDETYKIFYVGSGEGRRYRDTKNRSDAFIEHFNRLGGRPLIVAYNMSKDEARAFENRLIRAYRQMRFPLVNSKKFAFAKWQR